MKRTIAVLIMSIAVIVAMAGVSGAEEAAWYDAAENWIVRVYSAPSGADYGVTLEVIDTGNSLVTDPILGMATNPLLLTGTAGGPDVSLAFDEGSATAYVLYTAAGGGAVALQAVPDIARVTVAGAIEAAPNPVLFGDVIAKQILDRTVTIQNSGGLPVNITSIGTPGVPFSIVGAGTSCAVGTPLGVGGSCSIVVRFAPMEKGRTYNSSFGISSDAGDLTINLSGTGVLL